MEANHNVALSTSSSTCGSNCAPLAILCTQPCLLYSHYLCFSSLFCVCPVFTMPLPLPALRYGKLPLKACSRTVLLLYLAWLAAAYLGTAMSQVQQLPPLLDSLGLFVYGQPEQAAGALSLQLLVTLVVAGLARSRSRQQQELLSAPGGAAGSMWCCVVSTMRRVRQHWHAAHVTGGLR